MSFTAFRSDTRFCTHDCRVSTWVAANPDRRRQHVAKYDGSLHGIVRREQWESENQNLLKELARKSYEANREERIARATARNKADPEKRKIICEAYDKSEHGRQKNLEKRWRRIARVKNAPGNGVTIAQFHQVCEDHEDHCLMCLRKFDRSTLTMDHVVPISAGGAHDIENIQPLCQPCNRLKGTYAIDYRPTFWWRGPSKGIEQ